MTASRYVPRFDRFRAITARFDSTGCVNGATHTVRKGDQIGFAKTGRTSHVCCADCWHKWCAENAAADFDERQYGAF